MPEVGTVSPNRAFKPYARNDLDLCSTLTVWTTSLGLHRVDTHDLRIVVAGSLLVCSPSDLCACANYLRRSTITY